MSSGCPEERPSRGCRAPLGGSGRSSIAAADCGPMPDRSDLARLPDERLQAALVDLGRSLAWPVPSTRTEAADLAARARLTIERSGSRTPRPAWWQPALPRRRFGSSLALAAAALLVIAAIAGAIGLGLPGIR